MRAHATDLVKPEYCTVSGKYTEYIFLAVGGRATDTGKSMLGVNVDSSATLLYTSYPGNVNVDGNGTTEKKGSKERKHAEDC